MMRYTRSLHTKEIVTLFLVFFAVMVMAIFTAVSAAEAKAIEINVTWDADSVEVDADTGLPINLAWEKLNFYTRVEGGAYDYATPLFVLPQVYVDNLSEPVTTPLTVDLAEGSAHTVYVVVRSAANDLESADSDEASVVIDLTPLAAFDFAATFNAVTDSVDLAWPAGDVRVKEWAVYSGDTSGGPWVELTRVQAGTAETSISVPAASMFPPGQATTKYFTMVGFGAYGVFSPNAAEVSVTRDRTEPAGVVNLKIFLTE